MRKVLMAALLIVTVAASAFAKGEKVNYVAVGTFNAEFKNASNVQWTTTENFVKATFIFNGEKMEAFYHPNGDKIGICRAVPIETLPTKAKNAFTTKYDGYTVKEIVEFDGEEEYAHYIFAENGKESVTVKVNSVNEISLYKRTKK